jgi:hypothetical protein
MEQKSLIFKGLGLLLCASTAIHAEEFEFHNKTKSAVSALVTPGGELSMSPEGLQEVAPNGKIVATVNNAKHPWFLLKVDNEYRLYQFSAKSGKTIKIKLTTGLISKKSELEPQLLTNNIKKDEITLVTISSSPAQATPQAVSAFQTVSGPSGPGTVSTQAGAANPEKIIQDLEKTLVSAHNVAFGKENLLIMPPSDGEKRSWQQLLDGTGTNGVAIGIRGAVEKYAPETQPQFKAIDLVSIMLLSLINYCYHNDVEQAIRNEKDREAGLSTLDPKKIDIAKIDFADLEEKIQDLKKQKAQIQRTMRELDKMKPSANIAKQTQQLVRNLALYLDVTIDKVVKDLDKLKRARA